MLKLAHVNRSLPEGQEKSGTCLQCVWQRPKFMIETTLMFQSNPINTCSLHSPSQVHFRNTCHTHGWPQLHDRNMQLQQCLSVDSINYLAQLFRRNTMYQNMILNDIIRQLDAFVSICIACFMCIRTIEPTEPIFLSDLMGPVRHLVSMLMVMNP